MIEPRLLTIDNQLRVVGLVRDGDGKVIDVQGPFKLIARKGVDKIEFEADVERLMKDAIDKPILEVVDLPEKIAKEINRLIGKS